MTLKADLAEMQCSRSRALYAETRNGAHVWHAYRVFRRLCPDSPLPDWILEYFDRAAEKLAAEPENESDVLACFRLSKRSGGTKRRPTESRELGWLQATAALKHLNPRRSFFDIHHHVAAEFGVSYESVRGAWYKLDKDTRDAVSKKR